MEFRDVMYWVAFALMWFACGLNVIALVRSIRTQKKMRELAEWYEKSIKELRAAKQAYEDAIREPLD